MDCSLAESHYAKNEGLFSGGSGGGHPIGEDHEDQDLYICGSRSGSRRDDKEEKYKKKNKNVDTLFHIRWRLLSGS